MSLVCVAFRRRFVLMTLAALAVVSSAGWASQAAAQDSLGAEYLSDRACALLVLRTGDLLSAPETELWPHEIIQALSLQVLQIDSGHIAEIMLQVETPEMTGGPPNPEIAAVIRLTEAYEIDQVLPMLQGGLEDGEINGQPARFAPRHGQPSLYMPDDMTLIVGGGPMLRRIARMEAPDTKLAEIFTAVGDADNATLVVDLEALRPMLLEMREMAPAEELPPPLADLLVAPELLDGVILTVNITGDCICRLTMQATDEAAAADLSERINAALEFNKELALQETLVSFQEDDAVSQAWRDYAQRRMPVMIDALKPEVAGDQLVLEYQLGPLEKLAIRYGVASAVVGVMQEGAPYAEPEMYVDPVMEGESYDEMEEFEGDFEQFEEFEEEEAFEEDIFGESEEAESAEVDIFE